MENKTANDYLKDYFGVVDEGNIISEEDLEAPSSDVFKEVEKNG